MKKGLAMIGTVAGVAGFITSIGAVMVLKKKTDVLKCDLENIQKIFEVNEKGVELRDRVYRDNLKLERLERQTAYLYELVDNTDISKLNELDRSKFIMKQKIYKHVYLNIKEIGEYVENGGGIETLEIEYESGTVIGVKILHSDILKIWYGRDIDIDKVFELNELSEVE